MLCCWIVVYMGVLGVGCERELPAMRIGRFCLDAMLGGWWAEFAINIQEAYESGCIVEV
jgi:hypothetical protein